MAFALTCPECSAKLKTASAIPVGRKVQCPKCKNAFEVSDDNQEEVSEAKKAPPAKAPVKPAAKPVVKTAPSPKEPDDDRPAKAPVKPAAKPVVKTAPSVARKTEPDDDNPFGGIDVPAKRRRDEEDDETPRKRKRLDDDDEAPRARKRVDDDEDDEKPRARKRVDDDEEDEKPRKRKRLDDEEDEAPRARKRADDDEEDEKPRKRKRLDDDEEDEKPRKKGRAAADDDEEDSPRARKRGRKDEEEDEDDDRTRRDEDDYDERPRAKKKKKKGNKGLMIGLAAGGVAAIVGLVFLLIWLFSGGSYDKEMLAYLPNETTVVIGADIEKLMDVDMVKEQVDKFADSQEGMDIIKKAGLSVKDVSKLMIGGDMEKDASVVVVRFKKSIDKDKINKAISATEVKSGDKTYFQGTLKESAFLYYPKDDLLVISNKEDTMKKVVGKDDKVAVNDTLKQLLDKVGGGTVYAASSVNPLAGEGGGPLDFIKMMAGGGGDSADILNAVKGAKGLGGFVEIDNSKVKILLMAKCADSGTASKASDKLNSLFKDAKKKTEEEISKSGKSGPEVDAYRDVMSSFDAGNSGELFEVSVKFRYGGLKEQIKGLGAMGAGFGGGGGFGAPPTGVPPMGAPPVIPKGPAKGTFDPSKPAKEAGPAAGPKAGKKPK